MTSFGRLAWIDGIAFLTLSTTILEFAPRSMITMPATVSPLPSWLTAPWRVCGPTFTSATSFR